MDVEFIDTSFRDGSQCIWAMGIRHGMMEPIAGDMDRAGLQVIEVSANPIFFKKMVRDLKEDPWELMRMLAARMPNTPKGCMGAGLNINPMGTPTPPAIGKLFWSHLFEMGALQRIQMIGNSMDQMVRDFPTAIPVLQGIGLKVAIAIAFCISPRHDDQHYAAKTRLAASLKPDIIYLKDQGGLLTLDRIRTLVPIMVEAAGSIPVEYHGHCMTGLAPSLYLEALKLGIKTLHTGIPPLAEGPAQPSILNVARNARALGYGTRVDEALLKSVSRRLTEFARRDNKPLGGPLEYDTAQYVHQIPGGVISNLRFQLAHIGLAERFDEVVEETVRIREDLGYPIVITPYAQHICTQAALNVASGERYKIVIDELIRFAQGIFGEDSGYPWMDQNLKDKLLALPRAQALAEFGYAPAKDMSLKEAREKLDAPNVSDEELLLLTIMQGRQEIDAMRAAGPPKQYLGAGLPLGHLLEELSKHKSIRYVQIQRGSDEVTLANITPV